MPKFNLNDAMDLIEEDQEDSQDTHVEYPDDDDTMYYSNIELDAEMDLLEKYELDKKMINGYNKWELMSDF